MDAYVNEHIRVFGALLMPTHWQVAWMHMRIRKDVE